jgi:hypothetical protein
MRYKLSSQFTEFVVKKDSKKAPLYLYEISNLVDELKNRDFPVPKGFSWQEMSKFHQDRSYTDAVALSKFDKNIVGAMYNLLFEAQRLPGHTLLKRRLLEFMGENNKGGVYKPIDGDSYSSGDTPRVVKRNTRSYKEQVLKELSRLKNVLTEPTKSPTRSGISESKNVDMLSRDKISKFLREDFNPLVMGVEALEESELKKVVDLDILKSLGDDELEIIVILEEMSEEIGIGRPDSLDLDEGTDLLSIAATYLSSREESFGNKISLIGKRLSSLDRDLEDNKISKEEYEKKSEELFESLQYLLSQQESMYNDIPVHNLTAEQFLEGLEKIGILEIEPSPAEIKNRLARRSSKWSSIILAQDLED